MKHKSKQKTNNRRILPSHSTSPPFSGWAKRWIEIVPQPGGQRDEARNTSGSVATYRRAKLQLLLFVYCMINDGTFPILFNPLLSFPHYRTSVSHTHTFVLPPPSPRIRLLLLGVKMNFRFISPCSPSDLLCVSLPLFIRTESRKWKFAAVRAIVSWYHFQSFPRSLPISFTELAIIGSVP